MKDYITIFMEAIMESLKKYGLIPTLLMIIGFMIFASLLLFVWQLPDIILAIKA